MPTRTRAGGRSISGRPGTKASARPPRTSRSGYGIRSFGTSTSIAVPAASSASRLTRSWWERSVTRRSGEAFVAQLAQRRLVLLELEAHAAQDLRRLRELDLGVGDELDVVAPRVEERIAAEDLHSRLAGRGEHRVAVVDDEPEVPRRVLALRAPLGEREELVDHVDERPPDATHER